MFFVILVKELAFKENLDVLSQLDYNITGRIQGEFDNIFPCAKETSSTYSTFPTD
jgi:hypothetical protein